MLTPRSLLGLGWGLGGCIAVGRDGLVVVARVCITTAPHVADANDDEADQEDEADANDDRYEDVALLLGRLGGELDLEGLGGTGVGYGDSLLGVLAIEANLYLDGTAGAIREGSFTGSIGTGFEVIAKGDGSTFDGFVVLVFDFNDDGVTFGLEGLVATDVLYGFFIGCFYPVVEGSAGDEDLARECHAVGGT